MSQIIITLKKGDSLVKKLLEYCGNNNIKSSWVSGIGALSEATLALYHLDQKTYSIKTINGPLEIASLSGNIGLLDGKIVSHLHLVVSDQNMNAHGGHLEEATVAATCEIYLQILPKQIIRRYNQEIGLNLIDEYR